MDIRKMQEISAALAAKNKEDNEEDSYYNYLKEDPNLLSNWFPKVKDCGIPVPQTVILTVPPEIVRAFYMDNPEDDQETIFEWVQEKVYPEAIKFKAPFIFIKNGGFSDKFDARNCIVHRTLYSLTQAIIDLNYDSLMFDTGGTTELVLRQYVLGRPDAYPQIYHGLPLVPEYRVFYDFNEKKVLYTVNYWDYDYCHDAISRNITDKIIYEAVYPSLLKEYNDNKDKVQTMVANAMAKVNGMSGKWSVDIMTAPMGDANFCLIDMARAEQSAYWESGRTK
ncbi:MAG: hypothetical protein LUE14_12990 [Clostridiales bacterium]|nr:hypothetical protein [Clostridiales bacterium]